MTRVVQADVVVIGAGVAGLAAARKLVDAGIECVVVEARERLGGRIHTDRTSGVPIDCGASWIHGGDGNVMTDLASRFGAQTVATRHTSCALLPEPSGAARPVRSYGGVQALMDHIDRAREEGLALGGATRVEGARSPGRSNDCSLVELVMRYAEQRDPRVRDEVSYELRWLSLMMGTDAEDLSALHWDQDEDVPGADRAFIDGYDAIISGLASGLEVQRGCPVERIQHGRSTVEVLTARGTVEARAAIVTLPLGVLERGAVTFEPALSSEKLSAIGRLGMGVLDKVFLRYQKRFWPEHDHFANVAATSGELFGFTNLEAIVGQPLIVGWASGRQARALEQCSDAEIRDRAVGSLGKLFGSRAADPEVLAITRWASDPYAFGSYSHVAVGATGDDYDRLAAPEGHRLFFAGEATSRRYPATVHGAYLSGIREADRIITAGILSREAV